MGRGRLFITRHGKTGMNKMHALLGSTDDPLNCEGIRDARILHDHLEKSGIVFSHVFSSPMKRCRDTASMLAPDSPVSEDDLLLEMDYGPYEGTDLKDPPFEIKVFFSDFIHNPAPEGMEQLSHVVERAGLFLERIRGLEGNILIVTHAITMKGILECLTPESGGSYWSKYIGNCALYTAEMDEGLISVPVETVYRDMGRHD